MSVNYVEVIFGYSFSESEYLKALGYSELEADSQDISDLLDGPDGVFLNKEREAGVDLIVLCAKHDEVEDGQIVLGVPLTTVYVSRRQIGEPTRGPCSVDWETLNTSMIKLKDEVEDIKYANKILYELINTKKPRLYFVKDNCCCCN